MLKAVRSREQPGRVLWAVIFQPRHVAACRQDTWRQTAVLPLPPRRVPSTHANLLPMLEAMPSESAAFPPALLERILMLVARTKYGLHAFLSHDQDDHHLQANAVSLPGSWASTVITAHADA